MSSAPLSNRSVCRALFTEQTADSFLCNSCAKVYRITNGYSNLLCHLRRHHPAYQELTRAALRDTNNLRLRIVDQRTVDTYRWLEWIVMERLSFSFYERPLACANAKLSSISRETHKSYMEGVQGCVEARIKHELPDKFGLVLDGWSGCGRHYIVMFAVFSDTTGSRTGARVSTGGTTGGVTSGTTGGTTDGITGASCDYYDDLDYPSRRFGILSFRQRRRPRCTKCV